MARKRNIQFLKPQLLPLSSYQEDFETIIDTGVITNSGPYEHELTDKAAAFLGGEVQCVAVSNCTTGLMLALKALAEGKRGANKVVVPSFTFPATALAVEWCNLEPVFVDIDPKIWAMELSQDLERNIRSRSAEFVAFLLVNPLGAPANVKPWEELTEETGIPLIIDSAAGFGASYEDGSSVGTKGTCEIFSLHATKSFAVGEGGLIATKDRNLALALNSMKNFGLDQEMNTRLPGLNGKMPEMLCAIAVRTLERLSAIIDKRRAIAAAYHRHLEPLGFKFQQNGTLSTYPFVPVLVPEDYTRDEIFDCSLASGTALRKYYYPLHRQPYFADVERMGRLTVTESISDQILSLPMRNDLSSVEIEFIASVISGSKGT